MNPTYKRWYDHDPLLLEVIELLKNYQVELKAQAEIFLQKIEEKVSKETIDKFYAMVKPVNANNRWYDKDPVISRTVEILRIVPPEAQKICAQNFIRTLKEMGIEYQSPNQDENSVKVEE
ncbi:MAG: hypothetical protein R3Y28_08640 [Candidatus Gastranaerophilales bacterium]